jgi:hypothetical protein
MLTKQRPEPKAGPAVDGTLRPIDQDPRYAAALQKLVALEDRLRQTQSRREQAVARSRGERTRRTAPERAQDLLAGGRVPASTPAGELEAADEEERILRQAIVAQVAVLDDVRGDLTLAACRKLKPKHDAALVALLRSIEDAAAAIAASAEIHNRLIALGYFPVRQDILPAMYPPGLVALGSPDNVGNSQAWFFKEVLRKAEIIR